MVDRVPRDTVDCSTVAAQHSNGLISPHMKDVNLKSQKSDFRKSWKKLMTLLSSEPEATKAWSRPPKQLWMV